MHTVSQSLGFDVGVEESSLAAQLAESQPHTYEIWMVEHPKSHHCAWCDLGLPPEHVSEPVASPVHVLVSQDLVLEDDERLAGRLPRLLEKTVEVRDNAELQTSLEALFVLPKFEVVKQILPPQSKVGPLVEEERQQPPEHAR